MPTARLTAYGATAKGSGYANSDTACSTNTGGTQLLASDDGAVFIYAAGDDATTKVYLAKVSNPEAVVDVYRQADGFGAGQIIYVTDQNPGSPFGNITRAGYYTVQLDAGFGNAVVITTLASEGQMTLPTECEEAGTTYDYPSSFFDKSSDSGNDKQFQPMPDGQGTGEGVLIDRNKNINLDYKMRTSGTPVNQVPFILSGVGPQTLRGRSTSIYKCTTGDGDKE